MGLNHLNLPRFAALSALLMLSAAAANSDARATMNSNIASQAAANAQEFIGTPYKYGGANPGGFDCSGLIQFSYKEAGLALPRKTSDLKQISSPIQKTQLQKGDLVFFNQQGKSASHVGLYLGQSQFIHAPSTGGIVRTDNINSKYWQKHFSGARRLNRLASTQKNKFRQPASFAPRQRK